MCYVILENHDLLLLDEPTNHLDAESVAWLEKYLSDFKVSWSVVWNGNIDLSIVLLCRLSLPNNNNNNYYYKNDHNDFNNNNNANM